MTAMGDKGLIPIAVNDIIAGEIAYLGSFGMPRSEYPNLLNQVASGKLRPGDLVTGETDLSGIVDIYDEMSNFTVKGVTVITDFTK